MEIEISNYKEKMEELKYIEESQTLPNELAETDVRNLLWEGKLNFFHVIAGGDIQNYETFEYEGSTYRYLGQDLNSREKLNEYLEKKFTTKVVSEIVSEFNIIKHNGKLAQPDADFGSILDWRQAKFSTVEIGGEIIVLHLNVPLDDSGVFEEETVELLFQEATG